MKQNTGRDHEVLFLLVFRAGISLAFLYLLLNTNTLKNKLMSFCNIRVSHFIRVWFYYDQNCKRTRHDLLDLSVLYIHILNQLCDVPNNQQFLLSQFNALKFK